MRGLSAIALGVLALTNAGEAAAQAKIGVWTVELGKRCAITQTWTSDSKADQGIMMSYMAKGEALLIGFIDTETVYTPNEEFKVALQVDKKWKSKVDGFAVDKNTAAILIPATSDAIAALKNGIGLDMEVIGKPDNYSGVYSLDDTRRALAALESCRQQTD